MSVWIYFQWHLCVDLRHSSSCSELFDLSFHFLVQVQNAVEYLKVIGALDENENLTVLGKRTSFSASWSQLLLPFFYQLMLLFSQAFFMYYFNLFQNSLRILSCQLSGRKLSMLPVEPKLGKMLILGAIFNCLDPILTVVAGLSVRDPFVVPADKKDVSHKHC